MIKQAGSEAVFGCPMFVFQKKLQNLKQALKIWNKSVFGNFRIGYS